MAEKIKLLELDIDPAAMIKKSSESRKELERLKTEVKFLQKTLNEGDGIIDSTRTRLSELQKQGKGNTNEYKELKKGLEGFIKKQEENSQKLETVNSGLRKQQADYRLSKKLVDVYDKTVEKQNKTAEKQVNIITKTDGSIDQLSRALANNKKKYRELSEEQRNTGNAGAKLLATIKSQDKEYKSLQKSIGTTQVEVGNYKEQVKEALKESGGFSNQMSTQLAKIPVIGTSLSATSKSLRAYAQGQIASARATRGTSKALKIFIERNPNVELKSTPPRSGTTLALGTQRSW